MTECMKSCGVTLDGIAKGDWKHGPFGAHISLAAPFVSDSCSTGCYGDCNDLSSVPCHTICPGGSVQYGMTAKVTTAVTTDRSRFLTLAFQALGGNCPTNSCFACCCVPCAAFVQRSQVAKHSGIAANAGMDCALSCCCGPCVILQNANQVGEAAKFSKWKLEDLLKAPTPEEIQSMKDAAKASAETK